MDKAAVDLSVLQIIYACICDVCMYTWHLHMYIGYQKKKEFVHEHVLTQCFICPMQIFSLLNRQAKPKASWNGKRKKSGDGKHGFTGRAGRAWELCSLQCKGRLLASCAPGVSAFDWHVSVCTRLPSGLRSYLNFEREQLMEECLNTGANSSALGN